MGELLNEMDGGGVDAPVIHSPGWDVDSEAYIPLLSETIDMNFTINTLELAAIMSLSAKEIFELESEGLVSAVRSGPGWVSSWEELKKILDEGELLSLKEYLKST